MKQNIRLSVRLRMADADDGWEDADGNADRKCGLKKNTKI